MTVFQQGISLTKLRDIQDRYKDMMPVVDSGITQILEFKKDSEDAQWITENILPDIEKYTGKKHNLHKAVLFAQGPQSYPQEHVDGFWPPKPDAIVWSLNIPIINCEQGEMIWYGGEFELTTIEDAPDYDGGYVPTNPTDQKKQNSIKIEWHTDKHVIQRLVIDQPTIVKVDIPHQVVNASNQVRKLLAVRVSPNLIMQQ